MHFFLWLATKNKTQHFRLSGFLLYFFSLSDLLSKYREMFTQVNLYCCDGSFQRREDAHGTNEVCRCHSLSHPCQSIYMFVYYEQEETGNLGMLSGTTIDRIHDALLRILVTRENQLDFLMLAEDNPGFLRNHYIDSPSDSSIPHFDLLFPLPPRTLHGVMLSKVALFTFYFFTFMDLVYFLVSVVILVPIA